MKYNVILADPPVPFEVWGKRPGGTDSRSAEAHYMASGSHKMLDMYGIIRVLRLTQARHLDAARDLLYHNPARSIGLCESKQPHGAMERAFCV